MVTYGQDECFGRSVWYTGTDTLRAGYALCYDHDATALAHRSYHVEKPSISSGNMKHFAGVVAEGDDNKTGPCEVVIYRPGFPQNGIKLWTDNSVTALDILGLTPNSYVFSRGAVYDGVARGIALETQDRSSTAGTVVCDYNPEVSARDYAEQVAELDMSGANISTDGFTLAGDATVVFGAAGSVGQGAAMVVSAATDNHQSIALSQEVFMFSAARPQYFEAVLQLTEAATDDANIIAGFCSIGTADVILDNGAGPAADYDGAVFFKVDGGTVWQGESSDATTQDTDTDVGAFVSATEYRLGIWYDGKGNVRFYLDNTLVHTASTAASVSDDVALGVLLGVKNGGATVETLQVRRVFARGKLA